MKQKHVVIVGGGASGLVAAIYAARNGAKVTLLEQKERVGKKILSTGNGRCNLTNTHMDASCFRGDYTDIVEEVLTQFPYTCTVSFFEDLGILLKDRQGYLYPNSDQASTVLDVLRMEVENLKIEVCTEQKVSKIQKKQDCFVVTTSTKTIHADSVILATGGKAAPVLGSDGSGYTLAKELGHGIVPVVPALVQLVGKENFYKGISGIRLNGQVSLFVDGVPKAQDVGEIQLTDYGISGIPVFQVSRFASKGLYEKKTVCAELDFMPNMSEEELFLFFKKRISSQGHKTAEEFLIGLFHKKLNSLLLKLSGISSKDSADKLTETDVKNLVKTCKHFRTDIVDTKGFEHAQVCAGGVRTSEVCHQTMESLYVTGLYFAGEVLDIDGICGGYNLQWAWATGAIAGTSAAKGN